GGLHRTWAGTGGLGPLQYARLCCPRWGVKCLKGAPAARAPVWHHSSAQRDHEPARRGCANDAGQRNCAKTAQQTINHRFQENRTSVTGIKATRPHIALQKDTAQSPPLTFVTFSASFRSAYVFSRRFGSGVEIR